jgi:hypothetical protein
MTTFEKVINQIIPEDCGNNFKVPYSLQEVGITQSLFGQWKTCRRKFLFSINRWTPRGIMKFEYHSMMHYLLEILYACKKGGDVATTTVLASLDPYKLNSAPREVEIQKAIAEVMISEYILYYGKDFKEKRFESVEGLFEILLENYILRGKKDGRFRDKIGGRWHIEHKNYGVIDTDYLLKHLSFDFQNMFYALADLVEFNKLLKGVLYNIIRKPKTGKVTSIVDMMKDLRKKIHKDPRHYFVRFEIPYNVREINQFKTDLLFQLRELEINLIRAQKQPKLALLYFYKNESACNAGYQCEFLNACSTGNFNGYCRRKDMFPELV